MESATPIGNWNEGLTWGEDPFLWMDATSQIPGASLGFTTADSTNLEAPSSLDRHMPTGAEFEDTAEFDQIWRSLFDEGPYSLPPPMSKADHAIMQDAGPSIAERQWQPTSVSPPSALSATHTPSLVTNGSGSQDHSDISRHLSPSLSFVTDDERWQSVLDRDPRADGHFFYCVLSTLVFCRPTCAARRPTRSNVRFVLTPADAYELGCRACKRCKPEDSMDPTEKRQSEAVDQLQRALIAADANGADPSQRKVTVKLIAEEMGVSMWHLNRLFKRKVGSPPSTWAKERRAHSVRDQ